MDYPTKKIVVNQKFEFEVEDLATLQVLKRDGDNFRVLYKNRLHDIKILQCDGASKTAKLKIDGYTIQVEAKNEIDLLIQKLGFNKPKTHAVKEIVAPMPGLVLDIMVSVGDEIEVGTNILKLEAMKMENILKASSAAVVTEVKVAKGDKVEKGQVLIVL